MSVRNTRHRTGIGHSGPSMQRSERHPRGSPSRGYFFFAAFLGMAFGASFFPNGFAFAFTALAVVFFLAAFLGFLSIIPSAFPTGWTTFRSAAPATADAASEIAAPILEAVDFFFAMTAFVECGSVTPLRRVYGAQLSDPRFFFRPSFLARPPPPTFGGDHARLVARWPPATETLRTSHRAQRPPWPRRRRPEPGQRRLGVSLTRSTLRNGLPSPGPRRRGAYDCLTRSSLLAATSAPTGFTFNTSFVGWTSTRVQAGRNSRTAKPGALSSPRSVL